jgi:hypothetical protein
VASERVTVIDPRLAGIADALRRSVPMPNHDRDERDERHILRRMEIETAVRR